MYWHVLSLIVSVPTQAVQQTGEKLTAESDLFTEEISTRLQQLTTNWEELKQMTNTRGHKLDESLAYQQFAAGIEEEQSWITEKQHLLSGDDFGDTLATVQVSQPEPLSWFIEFTI